MVEVARFENVKIVKILSAKSRSVKEAFHHPAFIGTCPTTSHTCVTPIHLVDELLLVRLSWSVGPEMLWS